MCFLCLSVNRLSDSKFVMFYSPLQKQINKSYKRVNPVGLILFRLIQVWAQIKRSMFNPIKLKLPSTHPSPTLRQVSLFKAWYAVFYNLRRIFYCIHVFFLILSKYVSLIFVVSIRNKQAMCNGKFIRC